MLSLLFILITQTDCKTTEVKPGDVVQCPGFIISIEAAKKAFDIIENLYPKAQDKLDLAERKIGLLGEELKISQSLSDSLKQEIVIYKKDVSDLMEFGKKSVMDAASQQRLQSVIVAVAVGATIVLMIGTILAVGYLANAFVK